MNHEKRDAKKMFLSGLGNLGASGFGMPARDLVVLRGPKGAEVHGCRRILQYSPVEIQLQLPNSVLSLVGESLYCTSFGAGSVTVEGNVRQATYLPESAP